MKHPQDIRLGLGAARRREWRARSNFPSFILRPSFCPDPGQRSLIQTRSRSGDKHEPLGPDSGFRSRFCHTCCVTSGRFPQPPFLGLPPP